VPPLVVLLAFAVLGWGRRWTGDDAFIVFRVIDQVLAGNGFVFNVGERVEAVTSPLWLAMLVGARAVVPVPVEWLAVVLGLALTVTGLALAMAAAARLAGTDAGPLVPAGALVWLGLPPAWDFATAGLESGLGLAWIGACAWALARAATDDAAAQGAGVPASLPATAALLGLGPVVRPDFALLSAVWIVALLLLCRRRGRRGLAVVITAALAVPVVVEVARMAYYAALVPATVLAKEPSLADWAQGWRYLRDLTDPYVLVVPLLLCVALLLRGARHDDGRRRLVRLAVALGGLAHAVTVVRGGGDFMHARLLLPGLFALLTPVALVRLRGAGEVVAVTVLAGWALLAGLTLRHPPETPATRDGISDQRAFYVEQSGTPHPVTLADFDRYTRVRRGAWAGRLEDRGRRALLVDERVWRLDPAARPSVVYETGGIGLPGAAAGTDVHILDRLGLADAYAARLRLTERRRPGHDKPLPMAWVWGRYGVRDQIPDVQRDAARAVDAAMACPPLRELRRAITTPLTLRRALANIAAAPALTALRFPDDPHAAAAELCRGGER
jgi:arabinofuranosyltransferase